MWDRRRGYDVVALAQAGAAAAVGLEISETAVQEAAAFRDAAAPPDVAQRATFVQGARAAERAWVGGRVGWLASAPYEGGQAVGVYRARLWVCMRRVDR